MPEVGLQERLKGSTVSSPLKDGGYDPQDYHRPTCCTSHPNVTETTQGVLYRELLQTDNVHHSLLSCTPPTTPIIVITTRPPPDCPNNGLHHRPTRIGLAPQLVRLRLHKGQRPTRPRLRKRLDTAYYYRPHTNGTSWETCAQRPDRLPTT